MEHRLQWKQNTDGNKDAHIISHDHIHNCQLTSEKQKIKATTETYNCISETMGVFVA